MSDADAAGSDGPDSPEDPVGYFVQDMEFHGKSPRTRREYRRVLDRFASFLRTDAPGGQVAPGDASHRDCMAFVHSLRGDPAIGDSTVAAYASYLHRFYAYMTQVGAFDANPMTLVMEELDERIDPDPTRREISVARMAAFVAGITHPLERALVVTLLKTGMRVGELCNLDLRDLALSRAVAAYDLGGRAQLDGRPDSLYVPPEPSMGERYNGEERTASNKRKRATVIPVDDELERVLLRWLAVRPDAVSPADPLFVGTASGWGERLTPAQVQRVVRERAREAGWHETGAGAAENVTPHYFRHFFTTHLRDRTGERGVVKYLRGDVADDIIDTYTHNWGDNVRETYEESVYRLLE
ncbi:tyrosine-type recombinase/integrase [Candidatus Halobonum tyrrellensis]|uniref:Integrase family protein n=1 Tax=Candidatus Halobonum tyrrellensis G22 TaxID=1324957 RepID=V4HMI3_9EURY|nr:tyrosine-type recombinase/integrase [Candidatus Halobonum tyrrellensis]ESP89139.1 integrase family protein [Candidatus Halobonum tyrrellensis G22]